MMVDVDDEAPRVSGYSCYQRRREGGPAQGSNGRERGEESRKHCGHGGVGGCEMKT